MGVRTRYASTSAHATSRTRSMPSRKRGAARVTAAWRSTRQADERSNAARLFEDRGESLGCRRQGVALERRRREFLETGDQVRRIVRHVYPCELPTPAGEVLLRVGRDEEVREQLRGVRMRRALGDRDLSKLHDHGLDRDPLRRGALALGSLDLIEELVQRDRVLAGHDRIVQVAVAVDDHDTRRGADCGEKVVRWLYS